MKHLVTTYFVETFMINQFSQNQNACLDIFKDMSLKVEVVWDDTACRIVKS
jgi:hypothetical protein